jgi:3-hydroxyanthranilate 3,4-dioxygenase
MGIQPIALRQWIDEHRHLLRPPVGNQVVYDDSELIVMIVGGPNSRTDFHIDPAEELFYQLEGDMVLRVQGEGVLKNVVIREGDLMLLPPLVPHSPQRKKDTVGLVVERRRRAGELDGLCWFCERCASCLYREELQLVDITRDLPPVFDRFYADAGHRACQRCGFVMPERPWAPDVWGAQGRAADVSRSS